MIKVLVVDFTPFFGGGQKFLLDFNAVIKTDIDVRYAVSNEDLLHRLGDAKAIAISASAFNFIANVILLNNYIKAENINFVLLNGNRPIYYAWCLTSKKIAYKHTSNNALSRLKKPIVSLALNFSYIFCHKIVLLYEKAREEVFLGKEKVRIINNTIIEDKSVAPPSQGNDLVNLIVISRLDKNKGIDWLLKCYFLLGQDVMKKTRLYIAGTGPEKECYESYIRERDINGNVKMLGFVEDINSLLDKVHVLILPSRFESFPLSILEGLNKSLPIIATNTGGVTDMVIPNRNGCLIEYQNDAQLTSSIKLLVQNPKLRNKMGLESKRLFNERYTNDKFRDKILKLLHE